MHAQPPFTPTGRSSSHPPGSTAGAAPQSTHCKHALETVAMPNATAATTATAAAIPAWVPALLLGLVWLGWKQTTTTPSS